RCRNHHFDRHLDFSRPLEGALVSGAYLDRRNVLLQKSRPVIFQTPGSHVPRHSGVDAEDDIAVPWPGMIAVVVAWSRRMVGMRMIPADHFQSLRPRGLFCVSHIVRSHGKTISRRIIAAIHERKKRKNLA